MLLTRAPLYSWYCYHFLVRLACVRHAASVDSEPGSNSRLKPDVVHLDGGLSGSTVPRASTALGTLPCETDQAKPDRISRLARSTNLSKILEGDSPERDPWIEVRTCARLSSNLMRNADFVCLYCRLRRFGANFSKLPESWLSVKQRIISNLNRKPSSRCAKYQ